MNSEFIYDTTLRDGEQMPGVVFSKEEKIRLAKIISDFGAGIIGLMPSVSEAEREVTEHLANCGLESQITAATMMRRDDIDTAKNCGVQRIILFTSVSDIHIEKKLQTTRKATLEKAVKFVEYAKEQGVAVDFAGEDSTRADFDFLVKFINSLDGRIDYFLPCDTLGILTPWQTYDLVRKLKQETDCQIGLHIHNDLGQATASTLAGIEAGADLFSGTFTGIGERAGNVPLEEVVMALRTQHNKMLDVKYELIWKICYLVQQYSGVRLQKHKPISGVNAFSHESGTHVDGVLKASENYENFDPRIIGGKREILFGKCSGRGGLRYLFKDRFTDEQYVEMLKEIKLRAEAEKRAFTEEEIREMFLR